ncbi:hypothetical protein CHLNCDRAFT_143524 [Chlorella variabilis]|uniref:Carbohydrate binding module family 25 domain-containing protein n=1 Tax=Chlorella variabilis TaxID=554065 RepID=E1ZB38_CHLVA|nr:hypothetical protein CHLNCDRAFT_143524 [Chlorella variabilis]EFN57161.1 hypothetical protein CHLNCDRAFT_143524 [Chlorella variabilis]|eukprot:XP_005849263.1 hypothetical protein CHLNCDRAFT_143524 [Chlorella variabilis]
MESTGGISATMLQCAQQTCALGLRVQAAAPCRSQPLTSQPAPCCRQPPLRRRGPVLAVGFFRRGDSNNTAANSTSSRDTQDTLVSDGAIKSLSPEARRIFREAQDNIIELNKSRLRALEELKGARLRIAELEGKLEQAVAEASQATAQLQQLGPGGTQAAAAAAAAAAGALPEVSYNFSTAQAPQVAQQPPPTTTPAPTSDTITVVYETGWGAAYVHHNVDGAGWTTVPGTQMQNGTQQFPDKKVLTVQGRRMEFVINNGGSDWDKPNPYGSSGSSNYVITEPGTYRIKNGKVGRLA